MKVHIAEPTFGGQIGEFEAEGFGVGHPDPDSVAYFERHDITHMGVHGCDGCCQS